MLSKALARGRGVHTDVRQFLPSGGEKEEEEKVKKKLKGVKRSDALPLPCPLTPLPHSPPHTLSRPTFSFPILPTTHTIFPNTPHHSHVPCPPLPPLLLAKVMKQLPPGRGQAQAAIWDKLHFKDWPEVGTAGQP